MSSETTKTPSEKAASETAKKCPETDEAKSVAAKLPTLDTKAQEDESSNDRKRPAIQAAEAPAAKRSQDDTEEVVDIAAVLGYKAGDRFEVEWELHTNDGEVEEAWWPATLLEYDGRTVYNCAAVRVLKYDPFPKYSFSEATEEDVLFLRDGTLLRVSGDLEDPDVMRYRIEGADDTMMLLSEEDIRDALNASMANVLQSHGHLLKNLPAAQQAHIGSTFAAGKELLTEKLMKIAREGGRPITSEEMLSLLAEVSNEVREGSEL